MEWRCLSKTAFPSHFKLVDMIDSFLRSRTAALVAAGNYRRLPRTGKIIYSLIQLDRHPVAVCGRGGSAGSRQHGPREALRRCRARGACRPCSGSPQRFEGAHKDLMALIDKWQRPRHGHCPGLRSNAPLLIISAIRGGVSLAGSPSGSTISASEISSDSTL